MIKGIIFDMDGTMIDNMMVHHRAWQRILKKMGREMSLEDVRQKIHGVNLEILERLFGDKYSHEERVKYSAEKEAEYRKIYAPDLELIVGLDVFLDQLKSQSIPMGIGSAAPPENVDFVLNTLGLWDYFKTVQHSDNVSHGKPHPEIYHKVCAAMSLDPSECVIFEDSPTGAEAVIRSGAQLVVVTTTHKADEFDHLDVLAFISDFRDMSFLDDLLT